MASMRLPGRAVQIAGLATVYAAAGKLGLSMAIVHASATLVWPPTGISLAALLLLGRGVWPGILIGAFGVNLTTTGDVASSIGIAAGNTLEALIGAALTERFAGGARAFERPRHAFAFMGLAALLATTVSATIGVVSLGLCRQAAWSRFGPIWIDWWLGDTLSALVVAPLLLTWATGPRLRWAPRRAAEGALLALTLTAAGLIAFGSPLFPRTAGHPLKFVCIPPLIWSAFRFGPRASTAAVALLAGIAVRGALPGPGPLAPEYVGESLHIMQAFMGVSAVMTLSLAAVVLDRRRDEDALREAHGEMEARIRERTVELSRTVETLQTEIGNRQLAEEKFRAVAETAADAIVSADARGRVVYWNPAAERIFGYPAGEMLGQPLTRLMPERYHEAHGQGIRRVTETGEARLLGRTIELAGRRRDGTEFPLEISLSRWKAGPDTFFTGILRDITERKASVRTILEKEVELADAQTLAHLGSWNWDVAADIVTWSDEMFRIYGLEPRSVAITYESFLARIHLDDRASVEATVRRSHASGEPFAFDHRIVRPDGTERWVHGRGQVVMGKNGPVRMYGTGLDVTERKRAEQALGQAHKELEQRVQDRTAELSQAVGRLVEEVAQRKRVEQRFRLVVEGAPNGIVMVDRDGRIVLVNSQIEKMFGYVREELLGSSIEKLVPGRFRAAHPGHRARFAAGPEARPMGKGRDLFGLRKNGTEVPIEIGLSPLETPEGTFVMASVVDVTERKRIEADIARHAKDLARSNAELEAFAYVASHDLQEPLRMVTSYMELLQKRYGRSLDEAAQRYIHHAADGARRMHQMIRDLLLFSRLDRVQEPPQAVDCGEIYDAAVGNLKRAIEESGAVVAAGPLPKVTGHPNLILTVFQNLIGNGIKYRGQAPPRIEVAAEHRGDEWAISVRDNGIGIDPAYHERIFRLFQRLHERGKYPGSGIGLATAKKIVERHGGRIWVESRAGAGAAFHFTLPGVTDSGSIADRESAPAPAGHGGGTA